MTRVLLTFLLSGLFLTGSIETIQAESPYARVALMLMGEECSSVHPQFVTTLSRQAGVRQIDPDLVPDHILIDYERQHLSEAELVTMANAALAGVQCRAEIMKSCITADRPSTSE